ncbi:Fic family protein [Methanomicrobium antiquum]|uniref:Fic family protein n=1 Tax=Methanomicrobium antiquum TaxID=487686 RepID=A0AAF0JN36_9EURY|nr:Fic family protein [Methanomicrobium antiquum]WFN37180.1 Fic family protein [Methanomicrobium antiquum]
MEEFTIEEIIGYHKEIIENSDFEGDQGQAGEFLNYGNLDFTIEFSNNYTDPFEKAAYLLHGIAKGHPFVQGNKRLAFLLSSLVLWRTPECYTIISSKEENDAFVREIAKGNKTFEEVTIWLRTIVKKEL